MLDMKTVVFSYFITNTLITLFIALLWYQNRKRYAGLAFWLIDFILQAVGFLLLLLRDVAPDLESIVIAQMLIAAGALCLYIGLEHFVGKPSSQIHNYLSVSGFVGLMAYFTFVQPDISIRTILVSAITILLTGQCSWLLLRRAAPSLRPITREVGVVFLLFALVAFTRIIELAQIPLPATSDLFDASSVQVVFVLINQLLCIALTFALILMVTRRLELDVQTQSIERKRAEREIEHLASFPQLNSNPILEIAASGTVTYQNHAAVTLLAQTQQDARTFFPPDLPVILETLAQKRAEVFYREVEIDHRVLGESIYLVPEFNVARIYTIDVTERKQAEENLSRMIERLDLATRAARLGVWDWNIQKNELLWDDRMYELYGVRKEDFAGAYAAWLKGVHPDDRASSNEISEQARRGEREYDTEFRIVWPNGAIRALKAYGQVVWDSEGKPLRMTGVNYDITERKCAEAALKEYSERLEQMVEERTRELRGVQDQLLQQERLTMLGQIAGGIGHELRSPLGAIKNAAYLLNRSLLTPDPDIQETMQILNRQVDASDRIITSLLDLARPQPPFRRETDLREPIDAALSQVTIPENVTVCRQFDDALPTLLVDPAQLQIVFHNLIRNAVQAMPNGGQLTIATRASDDEVSIAFSDTGGGIAPEDLAKIFQPLFSTKSRGLGIGLALCKLLVDGHHGRIDVTSQVGAGTTFVVCLPVSS